MRPRRVEDAVTARTSLRTPETAPAPRTRSFSWGLDPGIAIAAIGLAACSVLAVSRAASEATATRQMAYAVIGLAAAGVLWRLDYSRLRELRHGIYALLLASIVAVMAFGGVARGSRRAIELPFFSFQASELGKVLLVLSLSAFVVDQTRRTAGRHTTARIMLLALVPAGLVMLQPDLGSALVYIVIGLAVLFVGGAPWRHFAALGALAAVAVALALVALPAAGVDVLHDYQKERLTAFLHPSDTASDEGYQQKQSTIAIGSGEKTGRGEGSTQTKLDFLPEHHTDFVFAVIGERWGFAGAALVLSLYALLIWRGLRVVTLSKNLYGALVAGGIVAMLLFQVFVNVGMNIGIMPITGIPLPLMSYGGSSLMTTMLAVGLLQSIHAQGRAALASKGRVLTF